MKILEFNKRFWFIIALVMIGLGLSFLLLNHHSYNEYLELKKDYVEVDCIVTKYDDVKRIATIAYSYQNLEYQIELQTIEYKVMDSFTGVIRPNEPYKLRFDNGYSNLNSYTVIATLLFSIALVICLVILKRITIRFVAMRGQKISLKIYKVWSWKNLHRIVVEIDNHKYYSEFFRTFENISFLPSDMTIDFYQNKFIKYIDLKSYHKNY